MYHLIQVPFYQIRIKLAIKHRVLFGLELMFAVRTKIVVKIKLPLSFRPGCFDSGRDRDQAYVITRYSDRDQDQRVRWRLSPEFRAEAGVVSAPGLGLRC